MLNNFNKNNFNGMLSIARIYFYSAVAKHYHLPKRSSRQPFDIQMLVQIATVETLGHILIVL